MNNNCDTFENGIFNSKINGVLKNNSYKYGFYLNNILMEKSSQTNQKDLPLCDLNIFRSKNSDQGRSPSSVEETRSCYQQWDQNMGTKDDKFMAISHARLTSYIAVVT